MGDEVIIPVLGIMLPIIISLGAFVMLAYMRKFKNLERMAIIEKGLDPNLFKDEWRTSSALRFGLLFIGAGLGFLIGYWLDRAFYMDEVGYFSMLFVFGGIGLVVAYVIEEKRQREK